MKVQVRYTCMNALKISLFLTFLFVNSFAASTVTPQYHVSTYGAVLESNSTILKDGVMEKVVIYPQMENSSSKRIIRKGILSHYHNAQATILICHGFMCDKFDAGILRHLFPRHRFNVLVFDFRAHGEDCEGQYCTFGRDEALDVIAAAKFLKSYPDLVNKPLIAYGFSMGAVSAIEAQAKDSSLFEAMILDCPFDSTENVLKRGLANIKFSFLGYQFSVPCRRLLERYAFHPYVQALVKATLRTIAQMDPQNISINIYRINPARSIRNVEIPCLFIHCKNDEKISVDGIKSLFNGAAGHKILWLTRGRRHFDSYFYNPEGYTKEVRKFLEQVLDGTFKKGPRQEIIEDDDRGRCIFSEQRVSYEK